MPSCDRRDGGLKYVFVHIFTKTYSEFKLVFVSPVVL